MQEEILHHHLLFSHFLINSSTPQAWTAQTWSSPWSVQYHVSFWLGTAPTTGVDVMQNSRSCE